MVPFWKPVGPRGDPKIAVLSTMSGKKKVRPNSETKKTLNFDRTFVPKWEAWGGKTDRFA